MNERTRIMYKTQNRLDEQRMRQMHLDRIYWGGLPQVRYWYIGSWPLKMVNRTAVRYSQLDELQAVLERGGE